MGRFVILPMRLHFEELPEGPILTVPELLIALRGLALDAQPATPPYTPPAPGSGGAGGGDDPYPPPGSSAPSSPAPVTVIPAAANPFNYPVTQSVGEQLTEYNDAPHTGTDFAMPEGSPLAALRHGIVVEVNRAHPFAGQLVTLRYDDGVWATFAHMSDTGLTYLGQEVYPDTTIGWSGSSGLATGPHLHLELHTRGGYLGQSAYLLDPLTYYR